MTKKEALLIWQHEFGDKEYAYDFNGRKIKREDYLVANQVGWVVAYMRPLEKGGNNDEGNIIILHHNTAAEKLDKYPYFTVDEIPYVVRSSDDQTYYYIEKLDKNSEEYKKEYLKWE